jgi:hypothetical protein
MSTADDNADEPVDMNTLLRNQDHAGTQAARRARLFGTPNTEPDETVTDADGGSAA